MNFLIPRDEWSLNLLLKLMKAGVVRPLAELEVEDIEEEQDVEAFGCCPFHNIYLGHCLCSTLGKSC